MFSAVFEYPKFLANWTLDYTNSYKDSWQIVFQGNKATMELDNDGYRVYPDPGRGKRRAGLERPFMGLTSLSAAPNGPAWLSRVAS